MPELLEQPPVKPEAAARSCIRVRRLHVNQLNSGFVGQWQDLEERSLEPNAFLSPHFVLPALRHLSTNSRPELLAFEIDTPNGPQLVGVGVFEFVTHTKLVPFPHMRAYLAPGNTFLTGLLIDQEYGQEVVTAFFEFARHSRGPWSCIEFVQRTADSEFAQLLESSATSFGYQWQGWKFERPIFHPRHLSAVSLEKSLSKNRRKKVRRNRKHLQSLGELSFHVIRSSEKMQSHADEFLRLENCGWKGKEGSSLLSDTPATAFFRETVDRFSSQGRMMFTELRIDDEVIASTTNFVAANAGFAFKSGWNTEYKEYSPGVQQEVELARAAQDRMSDLEYFDSGTDMDSWVETLWPQSRTITSGVFCSSALQRLVVEQMLRLRRLKRRLKGRKVE